MLPDGEHGVNNCVSIDNVASFPEYTFFVHVQANFPGTFEIGTKPTCFLRGRAGIFGVLTEDLSKIVKLSPDDEQFGDWPSQGSNPPLFYVAPRFSVDLPSSLPDTGRTAKIDYLIHVRDIGIGQGNKSSFKYLSASIVNTSYFDTEGNRVDEFDHLASLASGVDNSLVNDTILPNPPAFTTTESSELVSSTSPLALIWIVIVCMGACVLAIGIKTWKK